MIDARVTTLCNLLVNYCCAVEEDETILIEAIDVPHEFTNECVRLARRAGGIPIVKLESQKVRRAMLINGTLKGWELIADAEQFLMERVQCYIGARGQANASELSDVPADLQRYYEQTIWRRVHLETRCASTRWVVLQWPSSSEAQLAEMSTEAYEDYFFAACSMDYRKMADACKPLITRLDEARTVRLRGPLDTDLTFSIVGLSALAGDGKNNVPDGEVCTSPVRESAQGVAHFNIPAIYRGQTHDNVRLVFQDGRVIEAASTNTEALGKILGADEGSRYLGEFAFGLNPHCTRPARNIHFDEKMAASIHFALGSSFEECPTIDNGNRADIHWDIVMLQTPEYGGGEVYLDGELIRSNGLFVVEDLLPLNPDNLVIESV